MNQKSDFKLVGLTGGIASGKSLCSDIFKDLGAFIIDADLIARELVKPGEAKYKEIIDSFGKEILTDPNLQSPINRKKLRNIVFNDNLKLKELNSILEKSIIERAFKIYKQESKLDPKKLFIYDAATIYESKASDKLFKTIVVYVPTNLQIERLVKRDKISTLEAKEILKIQIPIEEKKRRGDFIIDNTKKLDYTKKQVVVIFNELRKLCLK